MSDADICRANGWTAGTRLTGTECYGNGRTNADTIRITAIGEESVLAVNETAAHAREQTWTLRYRDWLPVVTSEISHQQPVTAG